MMPIDRDVPLFHRLEQRRLGFGTGAIDLIDQQHVGENRTGMEHELILGRIEDMHARDVRGHEVGRSLHSLECAAERAGERLAQ